MASDEQIIADLTASLRQALAYIEADCGLTNPDHTVGVVRALHLGTEMQMSFDGDEANRVLKAAAARLATIRPRDPGVLVPLTLSGAQSCSDGLSDLLCWCRGFIAARPDDLEAHPIGVESARTIRIALRNAVAAARGEELGELPF